MTADPQSAAPGSAEPNTWRVLALAGLGACVFVLPLLFLQPGFVDYVDATVRPGGALAGASLMDILAGRVPGTYVPVTHLSFYLDYRFDDALAGGAEDLAGVMHLQSALLHILAAVVLVRLLHHLGVARVPALVAAGLFIVHPALLETVAVVGLRPAILAGLFCLCACSSVVSWVSNRGQFHAWLAPLWALLAMASSPLAFVLPVLGSLVARRAGGRGVAPALVLALPVVAMGIVQGLPLPPFDLAATLDPVVALVWPRSPAMLASPVAGASFAAVLLLVPVVVAFRLRERCPTAATGLWIIVVACLGAGWLVRPAADVPVYLAVAGAAIAFSTIPGRSVLVGGTVLIVGLGAFAASSVGVFGDSARLWRAAADRNPLAAALLADELASGSLDAGRREALEWLDKALPDLPDDRVRLRALEVKIDVLLRLGQNGDASRTAEAMCELAEKLGDDRQTLRCYLHAAECYTLEGFQKKIDEFCAKAQRLAPRHPEVVAATAEREFAALVQVVRAEHGDAAAAAAPSRIARDDPRLEPILAKVDAALAGDPKCFRALLLKGRITEANGGVLTALPFYRDAAVARPDRAEPRLLLARLYLENDLLDDAEECVKRALHDGIDEPRLHYWLGIIYAAQGRIDDAKRYLEAYLRNRPGNRDARMLLANLLSAEALRIQDKIKVSELRRRAKRIRELNPDDAKGLAVQAAVLTKGRPRRYVEAIVLLEKARRAMPKDVDVVRRLAEAHRDYGWMLTLEKRDVAMDHFKTFLELATPNLRVEAVRNAVKAHCEALEKAGRRSLRGDDAAAARVSFLRSTVLMPERPDGFFQVGIAYLHQKESADAVAAFEEAVRVGRRRREDVSHYLLPLLATLQQMGRGAEAKRRGEAFLASPGEDADPITVERIRALFD